MSPSAYNGHAAAFYGRQRDEAIARAERAEDAIARVKALHTPKPGTRIIPCPAHAPHEAWPPGRCPDCTSEPTDVCSHCIGQAYPCSTIAALDQPGDQEGTT